MLTLTLARAGARRAGHPHRVPDHSAARRLRTDQARPLAARTGQRDRPVGAAEPEPRSRRRGGASTPRLGAPMSHLLALPRSILKLPPNLTLRPMTYVEAAAAPLRKTGQIKLHGKDAFEGMRKAGRLVAECLDMLVERCRARRHHRPARPAGAGVRLRPRRAAGDADVPRLQEIDLHLDQPRGLPRHPRRQAAEGRRHRQHRRHADPRRLARRLQPHVSRSAKSRAAPSG